ncbi:MAG: BON domain-containing protein [Bryobacteraceae bacterium]|jgi:osmotically-inducible protein OsmY
MSRVRVLAALAMLAAAAGAQTVRPPANGNTTRTRTTAPTAQPRMSDAQLEAGIRARFAKSQKISQEHFQVHVQGGVATIEGKTGVIQHKGSATRMAKAAGALAVNNRIQLSDAAKEKAAANLETGRRRAQIKRGDSRSDPRSDPQQPH